MGLNHSPTIVRDGLVLYLDAANRKSYPGSGTTWTDLSGNGNNGTLANGPTFSSVNNGSIIFDGTNDYINTNNNSPLQFNVGSIFIWVKTSSPGAGYRGVITKQFAWGIFVRDSILITYDWGGSAERSTGINIANGLWNFVALTFTDISGTPSNNAKLYLNGSLVLTTTIKLFNHTINVELSRGGSNPTGVTQIMNGQISNAMIYNTVLSDIQVRQNFNALRGRYGI